MPVKQPPISQKHHELIKETIGANSFYERLRLIMCLGNAALFLLWTMHIIPEENYRKHFSRSNQFPTDKMKSQSHPTFFLIQYPLSFWNVTLWKQNRL